MAEEHVIRLFQGTTVVGQVVFQLLDPDSAVGLMAVASVPGDKELEKKINTWFMSNPELLALRGGLAPEDIGRYGDGIRVVLWTLAQEYGFTFRNSKIPMPKAGFVDA